MRSRLSRQTWTNIALAIVVAAGCGKEEVPERPPPVEAEVLPIEVDGEGWKVTTDCTLVMDPIPTVRVSPVGKFIDTPAIGIVPANRADWTVQLRPRRPAEEKAVLRLFHNRIPLKLSKQVPGNADDVFLTENDVLGAPVTTMTIKAGTVIMPPQSAEVIDRLGKVVMRHPPG